MVTIPSFSERCSAEGTRDVIFLFQWRRLILLGVPDGWDVPDGETITDENGESVSLSELFRSGREFCTEHTDLPCVLEQWETDGVWLSREEATEYGKRRDYEYPDGWRVYGICSNGELASMLHRSQRANEAQE